MKKLIKRLTALALLCSVLLCALGCNRVMDVPGSESTKSPVSGTNSPIVGGEEELLCSVDLMAGIVGGVSNARPADDRFIYSQADFGLKLFKASIDNDKNSLISPLSVMLALAMTANGASGVTLEEMETLLGGDIPLSELNEYLRTYTDALPSSEKAKLQIANSIWFRDEPGRFNVREDFLKTNSAYYGASAFKSPFDEATVKDINDWVSRNTDGMIDEIIREIPETAVMYLINALCFEADWKDPFSSYSVYNGDFHGLSGDTNVSFMYGEESKCVSDVNATGFIKPYENGYSFMAILPNESVSLADYIASLEGDHLVKMFRNAQQGTVNITLPKFKYEYDVSLNDPLKFLGMQAAFAGGFANLGESNRGPLFISQVTHKTFIEVDNMGTRAAAVTSVEVSDEMVMVPTMVVKLDRPFLYAIVDNATGLPVFIGTVNDIQ